MPFYGAAIHSQPSAPLFLSSDCRFQAVPWLAPRNVNLAQAAVRRCCRRGGLNNRHLFLTVLGWKVQDQNASWFGSWWEPSSYLTDSWVLIVLSYSWRQEMGMGGCSTLFLFLWRHRAQHGGLTLLTLSKSHYLPQALHPNIIALGVRVSTYEFGEKTNKKSIRDALLY